MQIIYSDAHRLHHPPFEILAGGDRIPFFETPDRMDIILGALQEKDWATIRPPGDFGLEPILAVHSADYVEYLKQGYAAWQKLGGELGGTHNTTMLLGGTFPPRRLNRRPQSIAAQAGYYSFDLCCPIVAGTYEAALASAHCALTGASLLQSDPSPVFALCRPPGHHAGRDFAGGYCYLNHAAIAAQFLLTAGTVAILDIDFHAGNGTQDIFYASPDVLTLSLHADPSRDYPYYLGYPDETGEGAGIGFHQNFTLPAGTDDLAYLQVLESALDRIRRFSPRFLILSFGADIFAEDPLGDFSITTPGFRAIGDRIASLQLPTLIVMEGGYSIEALGRNTCALLSAFGDRSG
ncbi:MAG: histone deacetylase family protein [Leptolyngbyaceae cyanobacterium bins.59]|nr:histone deacetylase family protein [Leptolyngbyaceae cyanobacterium bins.59]